MKYSTIYPITAANINADYRLTVDALLNFHESTVARYFTTLGVAAFDVQKEDKTWVISEINLDIKPGEFIGVIGSSGLSAVSLSTRVMWMTTALCMGFTNAGQILIAVVTMYIGTQVLGIDTGIWIPGANIDIDLGWLYYPLVLFVLVGTSNAVNLTDGLDGLASGEMAIAGSAFAVVSVLSGHPDLALFCVAIAAACLGFLRFNAHPAKVFMGDTGSLALGGALAAVGILTHTELLLIVIGFVFVCEALSVIIQVISFQTTGKRVFRMSPIHHHFELGGWSEWKVVTVFWLVGLLASVIGLSLVPQP